MDPILPVFGIFPVSPVPVSPVFKLFPVFPVPVSPVFKPRFGLSGSDTYCHPVRLLRFGSKTNRSRFGFWGSGFDIRFPVRLEVP